MNCRSEDRRAFQVTPEYAGRRLDQFLVAQLDGISRSRIQLLLDQGGIVVDGKQVEGLA